MIFGEGPIIKNIAGDLNKLFLQGSRIGQPITNVEGDAAADQGTVDLLAAMDPVIQEVAVGMSGEEFMQYTVSGTPPLSLTDSLGMPLRSWSVDVSPYQEGSGDPSPSNVRPIHGTDKLTITTAVAGGNIYSDRFADYTKPVNYYVCPITLPNGYIRLNAELIGESMTGVAVGIAESGTSYPGFVGQRLVLGTNGQILPYNSNVINWEAPCLCIYAAGEAQFNQIFENYHIWLTVGNDQTSYTPYVAPSQTTITLPQTVYTGTIGSDGGESMDAAIDLGDLTWNYNAGYTNFGAMLPQAYKEPATASTISDIMCECYKPQAPRMLIDQTLEMCVSFCIAGYGGAGRGIMIRDTRFTDVASFKAAVTGIKLVYTLATDDTFPITAPTILTPTGSATTWATAQDGIVDSMEVTYIGKA